MANLTSGARPQPYGLGGRKVFLPVKATTQIYEGALVAQVSGACVPGTSTGAGNAIGVAESDMLGGASDGSTRISVWTDKIFVFNAGTNAPTDATPFGTLLYMEDDHTVGTGGIGGAAEGTAGKFMGIEDDGRVRVFVGALVGDSVPLRGSIADASTTTVNVLGRDTRYSMAATLTQTNTVTLGTTGAVAGDRMTILSPGTSAHTVVVVNGGVGAGTLNTIGSTKIGFVSAYFDGTNWIYDGSSVA